MNNLSNLLEMCSLKSYWNNNSKMKKMHLTLKTNLWLKGNFLKERPTLYLKIKRTVQVKN